MCTGVTTLGSVLSHAAISSTDRPASSRSSLRTKLERDSVHRATARIDQPSHANGLRTDSDLDEGSVRNPRSSPRSSFHSRRTRRAMRG